MTTLTFDSLVIPPKCVRRQDTPCVESCIRTSAKTPFPPVSLELHCARSTQFRNDRRLASGWQTCSCRSQFAPSAARNSGESGAPWNAQVPPSTITHTPSVSGPWAYTKDRMSAGVPTSASRLPDVKSPAMSLHSANSTELSTGRQVSNCKKVSGSVSIASPLGP